MKSLKIFESKDDDYQVVCVLYNPSIEALVLKTTEDGVRLRSVAKVLGDMGYAMMSILPDRTGNQLSSVWQVMRCKMPDQRVDFMSSVENMFCRHCGNEHPKDTGRQCQCWNDE